MMQLGRLLFDVKTTIVGNDSKKVFNNRLAIKNQGKDAKDTFIDVVAWGSKAELIEKYYKKGYEILLEGHLINKTGKKDNVEFDTVAILIESVIFTHGNPKLANVEEGDFLASDSDDPFKGIK